MGIHLCKKSYRSTPSTSFPTVIKLSRRTRSQTMLLTGKQGAPALRERCNHKRVPIVYEFTNVYSLPIMDLYQNPDADNDGSIKNNDEDSLPRNT